MNRNRQSNYSLFLLLTLFFSIPFYIWGALSRRNGPFGLPISFLMIFVPFLLSLFYAFKDCGIKGVVDLFASIFSIRQIKLWAVVFCLLCMPVVMLLTYFTMKATSMSLPSKPAIPYTQIPLMLLLYFLGAIPEEFGWTSTLTKPFVKTFGLNQSGILIGLAWGAWHIIPWSWTHSFDWIIGMLILNVLMRTAMIYAYTYGGESLLSALLFHTMINVSISLFPHYGSYMNTWISSAWMAVMLFLSGWILSRTVQTPL